MKPTKTMFQVVDFKNGSPLDETLFASRRAAMFQAPRLRKFVQTAWRIVRVTVEVKMAEPVLAPLNKADRWDASEKQTAWATEIRAGILTTLRNERDVATAALGRAGNALEAAVFTAVLDMLAHAIEVLSQDSNTKSFIDCWRHVEWKANRMVEERGHGSLGSAKLFERVGLNAKAQVVREALEAVKAAVRAARFAKP